MRSLLSLVLLLPVAANPRIGVLDMSMDRFRETVNRFSRVIVIMHDADADMVAFQPWLYAIAQAVPQVRIARINVAGPAKAVANTFHVASLPAIKLFQRDEAVGKRIIDYTGPLDFEPLIEWCEAMRDGTEHPLSQSGFEPATPEADELRAEHQRMRSGGGAAIQGADGQAMSSVPDSVRKMAKTMVRETRLQRMLEERGPKNVERYKGRVAAVYRQIVEEEGVDIKDQFKVQEANRRARNKVMDEVLTGAPVDIVDEVNLEVNLGGRNKDEL